MKKGFSILVTLLCSIAFLSPLSAEEAKGENEKKEPQTVLEALQSGTAKLGLRYRAEFVDHDAFDKDATASTLRTTLAYKSGSYNGFHLFLEAENSVGVPNDHGYNNKGAGSLANGRTAYPVVVDPEGTDINQAYLQYNCGSCGSKFTVGRQAVVIGDQRFVGAVGWRQNHQTFDAARFQGQWDQFSLDYNFISRVNRIFGDQVGMDGHVLFGTFTTDVVKVTPYLLMLDYEDLNALDTTTYGLELSGKVEMGDRPFNWEIEYANQGDSSDNPNSYDVSYLHGNAKFGLGPVSLILDYELLEGDGTNAFKTPLATLHKFNGFADMFLNTPGNGLQDLSLGVAGKFAGSGKWLVRIHDFKSDVNSLDYGQEIDAVVTWKAANGGVYGGKLGYFDADEFAVDVTKVMFWTAWSFSTGS